MKKMYLFLIYKLHNLFFLEGGRGKGIYFHYNFKLFEEMDNLLAQIENPLKIIKF